MTPEQKAREAIDKKLTQAGWIVQDMKKLNLFAAECRDYCQALSANVEVVVDA